jgi:long-chain fatty acid transport protein
MHRLGKTLALALGSLAFCALPAWPAGMTGAQPGIKAMGMAGAFTAQANDPSAVTYNPGGLVLFKKGKLTAGFGAAILNESQYQGLPPGIGANTASEQEQLLTFPVHVYAVKPLGPKLKLGLGISSPFAFKTAWTDPDSFAGRYASTKSGLETYDAHTALSYQLAPNFGFGAGVIYRNSKLTHGRRIAGTNPSNGQTVDIASLSTETDYSHGLGWNAGLLNKVGKKFAWGLAYHSPIEIEYTGAGRLTQVLTGNAQLDALTRASLPLDQDLPTSTTIQFPGTASLGIAFFPSEKSAIELDVEQTAWSQFEGITLAFPTSTTFSKTLEAPYEDDALAYRLGLRFGLGKGIQIRLGYALEETPQPDTALGPFLPDADRSIFTLGVGRDWLDISFQLTAPENRITRTNREDPAINGAYSGNSYMLGISITK